MDYDRMEKEQWSTIRKQNKGRRKSEGGKDIQIQAWEGVIICRHKNAWMASILAGPKQMCRSPRRQTRWLCGAEYEPHSHMAWGRNRTPHPLCGAEAQTDPSRKWPSLSVAGEEMRNGGRMTCARVSMVYWAHGEGAGEKHTDLNVVWGLGH